jgi:hypothetical protein
LLLGGRTSKVALTLWSDVIETVHGPVPAQAPLQPAKVEPSSAAAVRLTLAPSE